MKPVHPQYKNRLSEEKSPYLLQHAHNPVDWFPWGEEAFEKARAEGKMVFLSIGYSTCHWCHVMERESFENPDIAAQLNRDFVSVKVDREERPDIDQIYMTAVQALTGSGGWPLSVFLTPDAKPITGGTYFPPEDKWGRPGIKTVLARLSDHWKEHRPEMEKAGTELAAMLQSHSLAGSREALKPEILKKAFQQFSSHFDPAHGGFGGAPKFPRSHDLSFLLRYWKRTGEPRALEMVERTLDAMAAGGMYDQLGDGFHRYSTDDAWLIPHFEKMLYDQAMLARTYLEAYQVTRKEDYSCLARGILHYVSRDMTSPEGAFYSAEDADSEGEEGKFYAWRPEEITQILGREEGKLFNDFYGVTDEGNFEHGTSVLHLSMPQPEAWQKFSAARHKLFAVRKKRIPPHKDDKILTSWNGLMISAFALAASILQEPSYAAQAERAAEFIFSKLTRNGRLLRSYREGESKVPGFHEDYAFLIWGLLDLYEATFNPRWMEEAKHLADEMLRLFWDAEQGGFFYTPVDGEALIARNKEYYDGAVPSGNSVAALCLLRLSRMTENGDYESKAEQVLLSNAEPLDQHPVAFPQLLSAADFLFGPSREIVLAGEKDEAGFEALLKTVRKNFEARQVLRHKPAQGVATAYVCKNKICSSPVNSPGALEELLL